MRITVCDHGASDQTSPLEDILDAALIESIQAHDLECMFAVDVGVPFRIARIVHEPGLGWSLLPMTMTDRYFQRLVRHRMLHERGVSRADVLAAQIPYAALIGPIPDTTEFLAALPTALATMDPGER